MIIMIIILIVGTLLHIRNEPILEIILCQHLPLLSYILVFPLNSTRMSSICIASFIIITSEPCTVDQ